MQALTPLPLDRPAPAASGSCDQHDVVTPGVAFVPPAAAVPPPSIEERLEEICRKIRDGIQPPRQSVRCLLGWIGVARRSVNVHDKLSNYLNAFGLKTVPDFAAAKPDDEITFVAASESEGYPGRETGYRISQLKAATSDLVTIQVDATLTQAVTIMMHSNYSQLPVMGNKNGRDILGIVSWKSIGKKLALKVNGQSLRDCMEPAQVVSADESFFRALDIISKHDYVLVRSKDRKLTGILTASDFNDQFRVLAEPFLLVGEIEKGIRSILAGQFSEEELQQARGPGGDARKATGISALTFGDYFRLLGSDFGWERVGLPIDRQRFVCWLEEVRELRNEVMHFHANGFAPEKLRRLQQFADLLRCLREAGAI